MEFHQVHPVHPSQRRVSCELCRKNKAKCQRLQPEDPKCLRCTLNNLLCDAGQQKKVGRPKRKEAASSSAVKKSRLTKPRRPANNPESVSPTAALSKDGNETSVRALTASSNVDGSFTRIATAKHIPSHASHPHAEVQSLVSTSVSSTHDLEWLGWPSFIADRWFHENIQGARRGRIVADAELGSPPDEGAAWPSLPTSWITTKAFAKINVYNRSSAASDTVDQSQARSSSARLNPQPSIDHSSPSTYGLTRKKSPLPFGIGRPPAYYVHENKFSSDPSDATTSNMGIDGMGAIIKLTRIAQGLRLRSALVQTNRSILSLNFLVHREGPFFIESYSLSEFVMTATQELVQIVTALSICKSDEPSTAYLVSAITDIYSRVLAFFQLFLEHLTDRAERQDDHPVIPIPGLTFNGIILAGPCTQGVLFSSSSFYLLGRLEHVLGLDPMSGGTGFLSTEQIDVLCDKLDRSQDLAQGKGIMRPTDVRKLYARVAAVLEQLSAHEQ
jgi:hypothetical protein